MRRLLIIGCGDVMRRVLPQLVLRWHVLALVRRRDPQLAALGITQIEGDLDRPDTLTRLAGIADAVIHSAPPPPQGAGDTRTRNLIATLQRGKSLPRQLIYISTSGVYGDCGGAWIDEDWPLNPISERGKRRLAAELILRGWSDRTGIPVVILRVPGIYGPGRLPVERVRQGVPVLFEADSPYSNRIHADDLALACCAAARRGHSGQAYNISDGHPTTMTDYFWRIADRYGLERPPAISLAEARHVLSPNMLSFLEESKRLDNRRMLAKLRVTLQFPDLASGLTACR